MLNRGPRIEFFLLWLIDSVLGFVVAQGLLGLLSA